MKLNIKLVSRLPVALLSLIFLSETSALPQSRPGPEKGSTPPTIQPNNLSLKLEVQNAIDRGTAWLLKAQDPAGHWSNPAHPALSGLAIVALQGDPDGSNRTSIKRKESLQKGYKFLLNCAREDGGIYVDRKLVNYNTSVSVMALLLSGDPRNDETIRKARTFITSKQNDFGKPGSVDHPLDGGVGYGDGSQHSDLVNTMHALEALHYSKRLAEDQPLSTGRDLNWAAAIKFLQNCQHSTNVNSQSWVSEDAANKGGFVYSPIESKAGEVKLAEGKTALRAYASISYAGMLSYIYAGLTKEDPRVVAVTDWLRQNYTLDENPGMGPQGLFFYFHTMAKALSAAGIDQLETKDGTKRDWRKEMSLKLINLQKSGGQWENDNGRWWEKDPVLSTAYSLIALEIIHRSL